MLPVHQMPHLRPTQTLCPSEETHICFLQDMLGISESNRSAVGLVFRIEYEQPDRRLPRTVLGAIRIRRGHLNNPECL
jgi:hypothetical protein